MGGTDQLAASPGPATPAFGRQVLLVWLGLCILSLAINATSIAAIRFPDPDDLLRLLQVRDWIAGQSWFDVHQYRIDPPAGAAMHWSRLIDPPIAAIILILRPLIGQHLAELAALAVIPLLTLGCATALVARLARQFFGARIGIFACLVLALSVPIMHQLRPMRIDHHGWQIVLALVALNAAFAQSPRRGGAIAGLALALWLAISIEGLPLAATFMGLFALRWLRDWRERDWLVYGIAALTAGSAALWLAGHRLAELWQPYCDVITGAHLVLFGLGASGCWLVTRLRQPPLWQQLAALALVAGAGLAALVTIAPQCASGDAFAALDPVVRHFWLLRVYEGLPLWDQSAADAAEVLGLPVLALLALFLTWRGGDRRWIWAEYAILVLAALAVAIMVERASAVAAAFAAPAAAMLVRGWLDQARSIAAPARRFGLMLAALAALAPAVPISAVMTLLAPRQAALERQVERSARCELAGNLGGLNALPPADFLAPLDTGPALLYVSHHRILASGHHRASAAMRDVIEAFRGSAGQARTIIARRGIDYVAFCPGLSEPMLYQADAPGGFMAQLLANRVPDWLSPVPLKGINGLQIYRVRQPGRNSNASPFMQ